MTTMRYCKGCKIDRPITDFHTRTNNNKTNKRYYHTLCKSCSLVRQKELYHLDIKKTRKYKSDYYDKNRDEIIRKRRESYNTGRMLENKKYIRDRRKEAIKLMGGKCMCCGITEWWNLTFDHIKPVFRHRRQINSAHYNKLIKDHEYREDFQLLCYGCNSSKNIKEKCTIDHSEV